MLYQFAKQHVRRGLGIARPLDHRFMLVAAQQLAADGSRVVIKDSGGSLLREAEGGDERNGGLQPRVLMRFVRREWGKEIATREWSAPSRHSPDGAAFLNGSCNCLRRSAGS